MAGNSPDLLEEQDGGGEELLDLNEGGAAALPEAGRAVLPPLPENDYIVLDEPAPPAREEAVVDEGETLLEQRERGGRESRRERRQRQKDGKWRTEAEVDALREQVAHDVGGDVAAGAGDQDPFVFTWHIGVVRPPSYCMPKHGKSECAGATLP